MEGLIITASVRDDGCMDDGIKIKKDDVKRKALWEVQIQNPQLRHTVCCLELQS